MSVHKEEYLDLCAGYALDSLTAEDKARLEQHLDAGCPQCEKALGDFGSATVTLAHALPPAQPGRALRERVLIAATSEGVGRAPGNVERRRSVVPMDVHRQRHAAMWLGWAAAAAFAVATALTWQGVRTANQALAEERRWSAIAAAPGARVAELELTPDGVRELKARAVYDPKTKSAVIVFDHFQAPPGKDYELWAIRDAKPASLGLIRPDAEGRAVMRLENVGDPRSLSAFAVSLENVGGSPTPTAPSGPVVMMGKLAS